MRTYLSLFQLDTAFWSVPAPTPKPYISETHARLRRLSPPQLLDLHCAVFDVGHATLHAGGEVFLLPFLSWVVGWSISAMNSPAGACLSWLGIA